MWSMPSLSTKTMKTRVENELGGVRTTKLGLLCLRRREQTR